MLAYALKLTLLVNRGASARLLRVNPSEVYWHICYLYTF